MIESNLSILVITLSQLFLLLFLARAFPAIFFHFVPHWILNYLEITDTESIHLQIQRTANSEVYLTLEWTGPMVTMAETKPRSVEHAKFPFPKYFLYFCQERFFFFRQLNVGKQLIIYVLPRVLLFWFLKDLFYLIALNYI